MKAMNGTQLAEDWHRRSAALAKQVFVRDDCIIIMDNGSEYEIELSRCATYEAILCWMLHLGEKGWVTPEMLRHFAKLALCAHTLLWPHE